MLVEPPRDNPALLNFIRGLKSTSVVSEVNCFSLAEKEKEVVVKAYRIIGVSILVAFLTIGLCYSVAWGVFDKARAVVCFTKGVSYQDKGQWDKAIAEYNKAIEINPSYAEAYYNRGVAYGRKGQYDQAISDCNKVIELNPSYAKAYYNRGVAHYFKGKYDKAWEDVLKAQSLGNPVQIRFLEALREASGRQE